MSAIAGIYRAADIARLRELSDTPLAAQVPCHSAADVRAVLEVGVQNRRVSATAMNRESSRSSWGPGEGRSIPCGMWCNQF